MNSPHSIDILNRLVAVHNRSLASYLSYASPTWHRGDEKAKDELRRIVADQREMVDRIGSVVVENDGVVNYGAYPMAFTGYHDLSFDFLVQRLIENQQRNVAVIQECAAELDGDPRAKSLAQEALGMAKSHLESLQELQRSAAAS